MSYPSIYQSMEDVFAVNLTEPVTWRPKWVVTSRGIIPQLRQTYHHEKKCNNRVFLRSPKNRRIYEDFVYWLNIPPHCLLVEHTIVQDYWGIPRYWLNINLHWNDFDPNETISTKRWQGWSWWSKRWRSSLSMWDGFESEELTTPHWSWTASLPWKIDAWKTRLFFLDGKMFRGKMLNFQGRYTWRIFTWMLQQPFPPKKKTKWAMKKKLVV